jgi:hypothetical protein
MKTELSATRSDERGEGEDAASLFSLQLRIAQRADDLARAWPIQNGLGLGCWLHAEQEVLHSMGLLPQSQPEGRDTSDLKGA